MKVRLEHTSDFYSTMQEWWKGHNFDGFPLDLIGRRTFIVSKNKIDLYCCSLYETDAQICLFGWPIGNPNIDKKLKKGGLNILFKDMMDYASKIGFKAVYTWSDKENVISSLQKEGFVIADKNTNNLIVKL